MSHARVAWHTFGCKANQYDTERMRQEVEARGGRTAADPAEADLVVVNTCTVTNQADAEARRYIRRVRREHPDVGVVVAGCSAALQADTYRALPGVRGVIAGHDPGEVAGAVSSLSSPSSTLVQLGVRSSLDRLDTEPVAGELLLGHRRRTRGWLKIQDGCDRKCSFCATRLARGRSRSRPPDEVVAEARLLAESHPELVLTGIHIGHYGLDLDPPSTLATLLERLVGAVPAVRFRLGSIEATEVDDPLLELLVGAAPDRIAPHLHMPLQSGADPVLRRMRRWHTRDDYRSRTLELAEALAARGRTTRAGDPVLGLGADLITGFPGETDADHRDTVRLVEELPFTYAHVFPFSPREGTVAAELAREMPVPQRVARERSSELRGIVQAKGEAYRRGRAGSLARVVLESEGRSALTGDYLQVGVAGPLPDDLDGLHDVQLSKRDGELLAVFASGRGPTRASPSTTHLGQG